MVEEKRDDFNTKRSFTGDDSNEETSSASKSVEPTSKKPKLKDETDLNSVKVEESSAVSEQKLAASTEHSNTQKPENDHVKAQSHTDNVLSESSEVDKTNSEMSEADTSEVKPVLAAQTESDAGQPVMDVTDMDGSNAESNIDYSMYQPGIMNLCDDVLLNIMRHCSARDRKALAFSCRRLNELSRDRMLWSRMDLRSDPVGRKQLTWFLNEFADKNTKAVMIKGHADSSRGCMGKKRMKPAVDKDTKNLRNAAMKMHSLMQDYSRQSGPSNQPAAPNPVRAREREARPRMTDKEIQTDKSGPNDEEFKEGHDVDEHVSDRSKDGPAPKKQKKDEDSIAGTSGVGGTSVRNVGEIEIIKTPKNDASSIDTKMELADQLAGPSGVQCQNNKKAGPSALELEDDPKPGPSGLKEEEKEQHTGKVEIVRTPKKGCVKKIENIRREFEKMRRELRRAGVDYSGLDKILACLNEKACQTGSDEDSYAWSTGCQSKAEDDTDSCSSSSSSNDSDDGSMSIEDGDSDNDRNFNCVRNEDDLSLMIPRLNYIHGPNVARRNAMRAGEPEPIIVRAGNNDRPEREGNQRLAALDLSGQNPDGNNENDVRNRRNSDEAPNARNLDGNEGNAADNPRENAGNDRIAPGNDVPAHLRNLPNDVADIVNMAQNAANIAENIRNMANQAAIYDIDAVRMPFNAEDELEGNGENENANPNNDGEHAVYYGRIAGNAMNIQPLNGNNVPQNYINIPNDVENIVNMAQNPANIVANIQLDIGPVRMAFDGDENDLNVQGNGENEEANVENGNPNIDDEQPMEVAVEFAINAAQIADHAADFADHAANIADNAADFVENAVDNMAQEAVIDEEEEALDLALDAAAIAERAADFAVQAANIADNAAIIAENAVDNDAEENAEANDAEMLNVALGIAMDAAENAIENEVFNRNDRQNANNVNAGQPNVIYMAFEGFGRDNENNNAENAPLNMENNAAPNDEDNDRIVPENDRNNPVPLVGNDANLDAEVRANNIIRNEEMVANAAVHAVVNDFIENNRNRLNNRFGPIGNRQGWQRFRGFPLRRNPAEQNRQRERQYYVRGAEYNRPGMEYCDNYWPTQFENKKGELRKKKEAEKESKCQKASKNGKKKTKRSKKKYDCSGPKWTINSDILRKLAETCPNLSELSLENCNINTHTVKLSDFPRNLKILSLKGCRCYNTIVNKSFLFKVQDHLPDLEEIDISECSWIDAASLLPLSKLTKLKVMKACNCVKMTECVAYASLAARFGFRSLEVLDLRGSPMGDSEVSAFGWLPNLREMYLAPPMASPPLPHNKHMHALYDHTTDTSDIELWEGDEDSPEISFRTAERALFASNVPHHCCLHTEGGCSILNEDPALLDPLLNNLDCSPEICNHTHRYTLEDRERLAVRERENANSEGGDRSRSVRERDLEREIVRRVEGLLRRNRAEGERERRGPQQAEENVARGREEENRAPLPGDRAPNLERNAEGNEGPPSPRGRDLEREIVRRIEELLRRNRAEGERERVGPPQDEEDVARGREEENRAPPRPRRNVEEDEEPPRPRRNVEEVMRAWENLAQEWHSRERDRNRARRFNMQRPVVQFREPGGDELREEVRVDAGGRFHVIYVNARRPRQDLAQGQVRVEAPNNARPVNEPAQREGYVNIRREYINGPANIRPPLYGIVEDPRQMRQGQGDGQANRCDCDQGDNQDRLADNPIPVERNQNPALNLAQENRVPEREAHRCECINRPAADDPNPGRGNINRDFPANFFPEVLPRLGEDFPYAINHPPQFVQRNNNPDPRNRAPGPPNPRQMDQAPRQADQVLRQADQALRQADQAPRQANQAPSPDDRAPRIADQAPRLADPAPRIADQAPRQGDQNPRAEGNQAPGRRNQDLEWHIGPEHVFRLQGHRIVPAGDNPQPEARVNVRRQFLNGPAQFRIPNQENQREGIHMNIHVHREIYVERNPVREQQDGENRAANNDQPPPRHPVGIMRLPLIQNIFYGPVGAHIEGSSLISDSSLLRFGLSAGNRNNYVHIGANGALQAVFPHANWTDKPDKARLEILVVRGYTGVTNRTLQHFATAAPHLREIDLTDTNVTLQGVESFSAIRPDVKVICDHLNEKKTEPTEKE